LWLVIPLLNLEHKFYWAKNLRCTWSIFYPWKQTPW